MVTLATNAPWRAAAAGSARAAADEGRRLEADSLDLLAASLVETFGHQRSTARLAASVSALRPVAPPGPPALGLVYADAWSGSLGWPAACFLQLHGSPSETRTFVRIQNVEQPAAVRLQATDAAPGGADRPLFPAQDLHPWAHPRVFALDYLNGGEESGLLWQAMDLCEDWLPTDRDVRLTLTVRERGGGERTLDPLIIPRLDARTLASASIEDPSAHRFTAAFEALVAAWRDRDPDSFTVALEDVLDPRRVGIGNLSKMYNLWLSAMIAELRALEPRARRGWEDAATVQHWRLLG